VVVVEEETGGGIVEVVCSDVVVFVTLSELPQPATRIVPANSATEASSRRLGVVRIMAWAPMSRGFRADYLTVVVVERLVVVST
jgi:hypothetical protein